MPNLRDIRRRIRSVKSTKQITRAMKMVSAARLKKAQIKLSSLNNYFEILEKIFQKTTPLLKKITHPYIKKEDLKKKLYVVISSDRGLCGSYNSQILEKFEEISYKENFSLIPIGSRIVNFAKKHKYEIIASYTNIFKEIDKIPNKEIFNIIENNFLENKVQEIYILSQRFLSVGKISIKIEKILPLEIEKEEPDVEYLYDPNFDILLPEFLSSYMETKILKIFLEALTSEQFFRMVAMELATKNADEMIQALTLFYNRVRQAAITKELIEIVSGAQALRR